MDSLPFADSIQRLSIQFVPFMMAVVFHECAHGFAAYYWGDRTAKDQGRLTLNPLPHLDPIGTVLIPIVNMLSPVNVLFGWARPVPIDPRQFKKYRPGLFTVSLAGPAMNVLLALLSAAVFCVLLRWVPEEFYLFKPLIEMTKASVLVNYALAVFNLIPLPPLDGSKIIESVLPYEAARKYESISRYSFFILIALMMSGAFSILAYPIQYASIFTIELMAQLFHIGIGA